MKKDAMDGKRKLAKEEPEFKNEYVENSLRSDEGFTQQPPAGVNESYETAKEPNGIDPETIFEKGYTFQETPEEFQSQSTNRFGKEPNGIDPENK